MGATLPLLVLVLVFVLRAEAGIQPVEEEVLKRFGKDGQPPVPPSQEEMTERLKQQMEMKKQEQAARRADAREHQMKLEGLIEEEKDPTELHGPSSDVVKLTVKNFARKVAKSRAMIFVEFGSPRSQTSAYVAPIIDTIATTFVGTLTIGSVNCDKEKAICDYYRIHFEHLPVLLLFPNEYTQDPRGWGYAGEGPFSGKDPIPYREADYDPGRIAKWIVSHLDTNNILRVTDKNMDEFHAIKELPKLYWFANDTNKPTQLLMAMSMQYERRILFGLVKKDQTKVQEKFGITVFPMLMLLDRSWQMHHYGGKPTSFAISRWLNKYAAKEPIKELNIPFFRNYKYIETPQEDKDEL